LRPEVLHEQTRRGWNRQLGEKPSTYVCLAFGRKLRHCLRYEYREGQLPESERASKEVVSLPVFPKLTGKEQDYVVQAIKAFAKGDR
jgi:dTDP-4-amino-4,6-dideoxygalactose transaminase